MGTLNPMADRGTEDRLARVAQQVAGARRDADGMARLRSEVDSLEVEGVSGGQEVTVVIDAGGRVRDVSFGPACRGLDETRLSEVTMEAIEAARRSSVERIEALVHRHVGKDTLLGEAMLETCRQAAGRDLPKTRQRRRKAGTGHRRGPGRGLIYPGA